MPVYTYTNEHGSKVVYSNMDDRPEFVMIGGERAYRDWSAMKKQGRPSRRGYPMHSWALAVQPEEIEEFKEAAKRDGVPTDFDDEGCPILTSREHRRKYLKHRHMYDKHDWY